MSRLRNDRVVGPPLMIHASRVHFPIPVGTFVSAREVRVEDLPAVGRVPTDPSRRASNPHPAASPHYLGTGRHDNRGATRISTRANTTPGPTPGPCRPCYIGCYRI